MSVRGTFSVHAVVGSCLLLVVRQYIFPEHANLLSGSFPLVRFFCPMDYGLLDLPTIKPSFFRFLFQIQRLICAGEQDRIVEKRSKVYVEREFCPGRSSSAVYSVFDLIGRSSAFQLSLSLFFFFCFASTNPRGRNSSPQQEDAESSLVCVFA